MPIQPEGSKPPLILVHGAGGDVLWGYANLAGHLGADQPVYGIKSRGQAGLEEFRELEEMAKCYVQEVRAFQPEGPYFLGGYCFGGNVAYEMARQLRALGQQVPLVLLLDSSPSNAGYETVPWWQPPYWFRFARNLAYWASDFAALKPQERFTFVNRKARAFGRKLKKILRKPVSSDPVDLEEVIDPGHFPEHELKLWQAHLNALVNHCERSYAGEVTLLRTRGQALFCSLEDDLCWGKLVRGGVTIRHVAGSHENIFIEPNVKGLAAEIARCLEEAQVSDNYDPI